MHLCSPRRPHRAPGPFETYLHDIDRTPLLTAEEERALARAVREGDAAARDHLVRANLRLVVNLARASQGKGVAMEDLVAEGNLGLMRAVEAFDPDLGTRFSTYAAYWIKQSIRRAIVNTGKTVRLPNHVVHLLTKWRRAAAELQEEMGRSPTEDEIARRLGVSAKKLGLIKKALRVQNAALGTEQQEGVSLESLLGGDPAHRPEACAMAADEVRAVLDLLGRLDPREAAVLRLRFGLTRENPLSLQEVGERLGCTRERVRQIEQRALCNLRELL